MSANYYTQTLRFIPTQAYEWPLSNIYNCPIPEFFTLPEFSINLVFVTKFLRRGNR